MLEIKKEGVLVIYDGSEPIGIVLQQGRHRVFHNLDEMDEQDLQDVMTKAALYGEPIK